MWGLHSRDNTGQWSLWATGSLCCVLIQHTKTNLLLLLNSLLLIWITLNIHRFIAMTQSPMDLSLAVYYLPITWRELANSRFVIMLFSYNSPNSLISNGCLLNLAAFLLLLDKWCDDDFISRRHFWDRYGCYTHAILKIPIVKTSFKFS